MSRSSYILLSDYAKSKELSIDEAREFLNREENKKFFKVANGREMVSTDIMKISARIEIEEEKQQQEVSAREEVEQSKALPIGKTGQEEEIERLRKEVEELREEIKNKDKQISQYAFRFAELAQQAQVIAGQAQALQAQEQKILEAPAEQKKSFFKRLFHR